MEKAEANEAVATALRAIVRAEQEMTQLSSELNASAERIRSLLNTDFTVTVSAEELLKQFEDQLKNPIYGDSSQRQSSPLLVIATWVIVPVDGKTNDSQRKPG